MAQELAHQEDVETRMKRAFNERKDDLLQREQELGTPLYTVGLEFEYSLLDNFAQASEEKRNAIIEEHNGCFTPELGAAQIEFNSPVFTFPKSSIHTIYTQLKTLEDKLFDSARKKNLEVLRLGFNPFVDIHDIVRTNKEKYFIVPNFHDERRGKYLNTLVGKKEVIEADSAAIIALSNSVQFNISTRNPADAVDKMNRSFFISPSLIALSGNSRFVEYKDLGVGDSRMDLWEKSHDIRSKEELHRGTPYRVGVPENYCKDFAMYLDRVSSFPFILDNEKMALEIGIGIYWNDTRIKFIDGQPLVEFRPLSIQPSLKEDLALLMMYAGRLEYSQSQNETLQPFNYVQRNRTAAMHDGLEAIFYQGDNSSFVGVPARTVIKEDLEKAKIGWSILSNNPAPEYWNILEERLEQGTPADQLASRVERLEKNGLQREHALRHAVTENYFSK